jgi:predicted RecB family nuclease
MSALLGNAAANLDDPVLRDALIDILDSIHIYHYMPTKPERLVSILETVKNADEIINTLIIYLTKVIDAQEAAWEKIALENGWKPPLSS